jgi:hypothetical protein
MWKWLGASLLGVTELLVSAIVHCVYGFYILADAFVSLVEGLPDCSNSGVAKGEAACSTGPCWCMASSTSVKAYELSLFSL